MSSEQCQEKVANLLYQFGEKELKPSDQYIDEGTRLVHQVMEVLKQKSKSSIAEVRYAGSVKKKTHVIQPDFDLVVVLNDRHPPFEPVLKIFEAILLMNHKELEIRKESIGTTEFAIHFEFTNGIPVDLLPAANLEPKEVFELLLKTPNDKDKAKFYSSSFVETQIGFVTSHSSSFVHVVVRLAKFWFKSLSFGCKVRGGGAIMEIIGIAAAEKVLATYDKLCVLRALDEVLKMISNLNTLKLAFKQVTSDNWERVHEYQLRSGQGLIPGIVATPEIFKRKCFIMEPGNPFSDFLEDKEKLMERFMEFARVSKERLSNLVAGHYTTFDGENNVVTVDILKLFEPQPGILKTEFPTGAPDDFYVQYARPYSSPYCDMKVRNEAPLKRKEVKMMLDIMKRNLCTVVNATAGMESLSGKGTINDVAGAVRNMINQNLSTNLVPGWRDEEEMDVTLSVPYEMDGRRYAVKFSMSWKANRQ